MECRLCLEVEGSIPIFDNINNLLEKIRICCGITIITDDRLPNKICTLCQTKLDSFAEFKHTCELSEKILINRLNSNEYANNSNLNYEHNVSLEGNCNLDVDVKSELYIKVDRCKEIEDSSQQSFHVKIEHDENEIFSNVTSEIDIKDEMHWSSHEENSSIDSSDKMIQNSISVEDKNDGNNTKQSIKTCCNLCNKTMTKKSMNRHMRLIHNKINQNSVKTINEIEILINQKKCSLCNEIFRKKESLQRHLIRVHKVTKIKYVECKILKNDDMTNLKCFKCRKCDLVFDNETMFIEHNLFHKNESFECDICHKSFVRKYNIKCHMQRHMKTIKMYSCDKCEYRSASMANVRQHNLSVHMKLKKFQCNICGKLLATTGSYKVHSNMHSNAILYKCDYCGKSFHDKSCLRAHILLHLGIKRYKCELCLKRFSLRGTLKTHILQHTGENPFPCNLCDKAFKQKCSLKSHIRHNHKDVT